MGIKPDEFWNMTFSEVDLACKGYETRMARIKEVPRLVANILYNVNRGKSPALPLEKTFPLYTDKVNIRLMTKKEYEEMNKMFDEWHSSKN